MVIPWNQIRTPTPQQNTSPLTRLARDLTGGVCALRRDNPGLFRNPLDVLPVGGDAIAGLNDAFWDGLCGPGPAQPIQDQPVPYRGGQCAVLYRIAGFVDTGQASGLTASDAIDNVPGPLGAITWIVQDNPQGTQRSYVLRVVDANGVTRQATVFSAAPSQYGGKWIEVRRVDGQPDNCGNPPPPPPTPRPTQWPSINIPIVIGGQVRPTLIEFNAPITFNNPFQFAPTFSAGPINFTLSPEGFDFDFEPTVNIGPGGGGGPTINEIQNVVNEGNETQTTTINNILRDRTDELAEFIRCLIERPNETVESVPLTGDSPGGDFVLPARTFAVAIGRNDPLRPGTRTQSGANGLPNVEFWGWFAVGRNGNFGVREPLSYQDTVVPIEERFNEIRINPVFANRFGAFALRWVNNCSLDE